MHPFKEACVNKSGLVGIDEVFHRAEGILQLGSYLSEAPADVVV
jgi:hypothetical protein